MKLRGFLRAERSICGPILLCLRGTPLEFLGAPRQLSLAGLSHHDGQALCPRVRYDAALRAR